MKHRMLLWPMGVNAPTSFSPTSSEIGCRSIVRDNNDGSKPAILKKVVPLRAECSVSALPPAAKGLREESPGSTGYSASENRSYWRQ